MKDQKHRGRLAASGLALADILRRSDPKRALAVYDHVLRHLAEIQNNVSFLRYEVNVLARSANPLSRLGRPDDGRRRLDRAFALLTQLKQYPAEKIEPGSETDDALRTLADFEAGNGNLKGAVEICDKLLTRLQTAEPDAETSLETAVHLSNLHQQTAVLHRRSAESGLPASALDKKTAYAVGSAGTPRLPNNAFVRRQLAAARRP